MNDTPLLSTRFLKREDIPVLHGLDLSFKGIARAKQVVLDYHFIDEPNNGNVLLHLSLSWAGEDLVGKFGIKPGIRLPHQYPKFFQLVNPKENVVAVPHNEGVYLLNLDLGTKQMIKYQSDRFIMSFFVDNVFVLVEEHGCKLFDLGTEREQSIRMEEEHLIIRSVQLANQKIYIILFDVSVNKLKMYCFDPEHFSSNHYKVFNLADLIPDSQLNPNLRYEEDVKLVAIPDFKFNHTIDSWLHLHNSNWNTLIGQVTHWDVPYKEADYFLRKERFDFIEITLTCATSTKS
jgi:hypothetical protein